MFRAFDIDHNGRVSLDELLRAPAGYAASHFAAVATEEKAKAQYYWDIVIHERALFNKLKLYDDGKREEGRK